MSLTAPEQAAIQQILQSELDCVKSLLQSLTSEYEALSTKNVVDIEVIVAQKEQYIKQLELVTKQREAMLATIPAIQGSNDTAVNRYRFTDVPVLENLWNELIIEAENCRLKNRINGSIVDMVSRQSRQALDLLNGISPDSTVTSSVYDNAGQTKNYPSKRSLVHV